MIKQHHDKYLHGYWTVVSSALRQLLTPLQFLAIKHEALNLYKFWIPLTLALLLGVPFSLYGSEQTFISGEASLVKGVSELLKFLIGFFVTSLAVIATYTRKGLDQLMSGSEVRLGDDELTVRRFLTHLYGYLAFSSFGLYIINLVLIMATPDFSGSTMKWGLMVLGYSFLLAHVFSIFLLGLHFLTDLKANRGAIGDE
jgi:hypothetical protein